MANSGIKYGIGALFSLLVCYQSAAFSAESGDHYVFGTAAERPSNVSLTPDEAVNIRVYKACNRGVVNISSITAEQDMFLNMVPRQGCGSGVVISPEGYILTNHHVIEDSNQVKVILWDGTIFPAQVVGQDPSNDLAVLRIKVPPNKKLTVIPFGDSSRLEVGRRVLAIGNPFGLDRTMTAGIISSLGRTIRTENDRLIKGAIQTDAAINPGNSGGPLLDASGKVVGINTVILSSSGQSAGIGLAIPINIAKHIIPELIAHHHVTRPDVGIQKLAPSDNGLKVVKLDPDGPAAKAGVSGPKIVTLRQGPFTYQWLDWSLADVLISVDNVPLRNEDDLFSYIELKRPGQVVTLTILRGGKILKIPVKLTTVNST